MTDPRLPVVWDPRYAEYNFGPGHPFSMAHRELGADLLAEAEGAERRLRWIRTIEPAELSELRRFHQEEYLQLVEGASRLERRIFLDGGDTPAFLGCHEAAARIVQGSIETVRAAIDRAGPAFHPAGGLHHAHPDRASGFCIYNDVALAVATAHRALGRVAYLDIDAHHGDGVMYGFYSSGDVLDIDFHQDGRTLFPGTGDIGETGISDGAGLKVNLPLPPGAGDRALVGLFRRVARPMLEEFRPQVIVLQHGADGHAGDPLTELRYTALGYTTLLQELLAFAEARCAGRLIVTGGGGYHAAHVALTLARAGYLLAHADELVEPDAPLPEAWRREFETREGGPAPRTWGESLAPAPDQWSASEEESLIERLEIEFGRRFPSSP